MDLTSDLSSRISSKLITFNTRISKLFKNPQINFLIIMLLVLLITCYSFLATSLKHSITNILSNPSITVICIIIILAIGYFDIAIASLTTILFFILLFGWTNLDDYPTQLEGFQNNKRDTTSDGDDTTSDGDDTTSDGDDMDKHVKKITKSLEKSKNNLKAKAEKEKKLDEQVANIKDVVLGTINKFRQSNDDDYKKALLENKHAMFKDELENTKHTKSKKNNKKSNNRKREKFQTIEIRALDPSNEEDTNLLITKEILNDMLNRIEYNYESNKYLRKYIKHRIEEIIDLNKLTDDE